MMLLTGSATSLIAQSGKGREIANDDVPTDAEVYSQLKPEILTKTRSGDTTNVLIQIPAAADTLF
jgi:hypothetical protein